MLVALLDSPVMAEQNKAESREGMGDMQSMSQMMAECQKHQQVMVNAMDQMTKMMQEAKQSNSPTNMRAALDEAQKPLMDMKERMKMCMNMMNMMQNMPRGMSGQMGGMMQGSAAGQMPKSTSMMGGAGMGEMNGKCAWCSVEMVLLGLLTLAAIATLIALTIFLIRRSRRPA